MTLTLSPVAHGEWVGIAYGNTVDKPIRDLTGNKTVDAMGRTPRPKLRISLADTSAINPYAEYVSGSGTAELVVA